MLHNARVRAHAKMRNTDEAVRAIGRSDEIFSHATEGEDTPWMAYYDHAQHHGDTGHAFFDLALLAGHRPSAAAERLEIAIKEHGDGYVRSRGTLRDEARSTRLGVFDRDRPLTTYRSCDASRLHAAATRESLIYAARTRKDPNSCRAAGDYE